MTRTIEYTTIDKSGWPVGPWQQEPDKRQWQDAVTGMPCLIVRGPIGALCGYVGVAVGHPMHGKGYDDCLVDVHGGLTFAAGCGHGDESKGICHIPGEGQPDDVWWFGFDCSHCDDLMPASTFQHNYGIYRDIDYVSREVANLAQQLKEMEHA